MFHPGKSLSKWNKGSKRLVTQLLQLQPLSDNDIGWRQALGGTKEAVYTRWPPRPLPPSWTRATPLWLSDKTALNKPVIGGFFQLENIKVPVCLVNHRSDNFRWGLLEVWDGWGSYSARCGMTCPKKYGRSKLQRELIANKTSLPLKTLC